MPSLLDAIGRTLAKTGNKFLCFYGCIYIDPSTVKQVNPSTIEFRSYTRTRFTVENRDGSICIKSSQMEGLQYNYGMCGCGCPGCTFDTKRYKYNNDHLKVPIFMKYLISCFIQERDINDDEIHDVRLEYQPRFDNGGDTDVTNLSQIRGHLIENLDIPYADILRMDINSYIQLVRQQPEPVFVDKDVAFGYPSIAPGGIGDRLSVMLNHLITYLKSSYGPFLIDGSDRIMTKKAKQIERILLVDKESIGSIVSPEILADIDPNNRMFNFARHVILFRFTDNTFGAFALCCSKRVEQNRLCKLNLFKKATAFNSLLGREVEYNRPLDHMNFDIVQFGSVDVLRRLCDRLVRYIHNNHLDTILACDPEFECDCFIPEKRLSDVESLFASVKTRIYQLSAKCSPVDGYKGKRVPKNCRRIASYLRMLNAKDISVSWSWNGRHDDVSFEEIKQKICLLLTREHVADALGVALVGDLHVYMSSLPN